VLLGELEANKHLKQSKTLLRPSDRLPSWFEKVLCALRSPRLVGYTRGARLYPKTIEELSLTLEGVDDVHGSNCLAFSVLGVYDSVTDEIFEERLEYIASFVVDETGDALDTATTSETADSRLGYAVNVITENLSMALGTGTTVSKSFASLSLALGIKLWPKTLSLSFLHLTIGMLAFAHPILFGAFVMRVLISQARQRFEFLASMLHPYTFDFFTL
jgi:hypothetical protein